MKPITINGNDYFELSTGKRFYAFHHSLSLCQLDGEDDEYWSVAYGSDGGESLGHFTNAELVEIADYMLQCWTVFRQKALDDTLIPAWQREEDDDA